MWILYGILRMLLVLTVFSFGHIVWPWMAFQHWPVTHNWGLEQFLPLGIYSVGALSGAFAATSFLLAWGLSERQPWARPLGIVLGVFALLRFPFGTALGLYTLWVLLPAPSRREYEQIAHA
jgi:hypothetical protein